MAYRFFWQLKQPEVGDQRGVTGADSGVWRSHRQISMKKQFSATLVVGLLSEGVSLDR
jgi:hypothetical protein